MILKRKIKSSGQCYHGQKLFSTIKMMSNITSRKLCTTAILRINACLLSGLYQTGKVETKTETVDRNMIMQGSSSKRLLFELPGCTVHVKEV